MNWTLFFSIGVPILATAIVSIIAWLLKNAIGGLQKTDERIESKVDKIQSFSQVAANSIVEVQTLLTGNGYTINQRLAYTSASPVRLTDYGETLMKESGFTDVLKINSTFFVDLVKGKNPLSNYDIQEFSKKVLRELTDSNNQLLTPLKNYAYIKGLPLEILINSGVFFFGMRS